jgi:hypothetical protein
MTVRLLDMDDATIARFLALYVPALESVEAPDQDLEIARARARDTIDTLTEAGSAIIRAKSNL